MSLQEECDKAPEAQNTNWRRGWFDANPRPFSDESRAKRPIHPFAWGDET